MFKLYFQNFKHEAAVEARIIPGAGVAHLVIAGEDHQPWHSYSAPIEDMAALLQDLLGQTKAILNGHNPLSEEWHGEAQPADVEHWQRRPKHEITAEHLRGLDDEAALSLLIERFRNSDAKIYNALLTDYFTLTKHHYKDTSAADLEAEDAPLAHASARPNPSQLQRDLETIRPHLASLIENGQLVKGIQSRIAEVLSITNSGVTNRKRILAINRVLETHLARKNSSSTSSSTTESRTELDSGEKQAA